MQLNNHLNNETLIMLYFNIPNCVSKWKILEFLLETATIYLIFSYWPSDKRDKFLKNAGQSTVHFTGRSAH